MRRRVEALVYLKKIETKGFKSMGPKLMSTPVERGFVAITGPNGSGKSNLLDAILFALGENSAKTLRVPNLSALIYDGSIEEQKPSSARVSLQFDNTDRRIPVDSDNVTITRELKISGESSYFLNGRHIQRNNLSELLEMALITSRGLNVVLQGMITRISELVPDEKRKLIEQMVGVAQFDEKRNLAMAQLKEADVKLEVAMAKIGEIRDRVQLLEKERNDQLRLKQLDDQISWLRAATTSLKLSNVRRNIGQRRELVSQLTAKYQSLQTRQAELLKSIEVLDQERNQLIQSAMDAGSAKVQLEVSKLENEIAQLTRERNEASDFMEKVRQILPTYEKMSLERVEEISKAESHIRFLEQKIAETLRRREELNVELGKLNSERAVLESEFSTAQSKVLELRRLKDSEDVKLLKAREELSSLKNDLKLLGESKSGLQEKIKFYTDGIVSAQRNIADLENLLEAHKGELAQLRETRSGVESMRRKVSEQLDIALTILDKAQLAVTRYDSDLSAIENIAGEEIALTRLESLGQSAALQGYLGPLRSLISYGEEYSQAIAALGKEWLNAVIVEDMGSLIRVTETAKKLKIARLTAIPLSEVGDLQRNEVKPFQGLISPVSDIIRCEPRLECIVNFVFGDALIVESAKYAYIAARRGFRAVTPQGDVFEPDLLAFETGYSKKYAKIASLLSQQDTFEGIRSALSALKRAIDKRKGSISKLHEKTQSYQKTETEKDISIAKLESKLEGTKQYFNRFQESSNALGEKLKSTELEIQKLQRELGNSERKVEALSMASQKLGEVLSSLDLSTFNARSADISKRRSKIDSELELVTIELRDLESELIRTRGDLENNKRPALESLKQQQFASQSNYDSKANFLRESEARLRELESNLASLREREAETLEKAHRFQPLLEELDLKLKALKSEENSVSRAALAADKELFASNTDLTRSQDTERNLVGELAIYGYTEPIESFEGADLLLKELLSEYDALRNNVNLLADKSYKEVFENYKYSTVRKNDLEKDRNAIVTFIETIEAEKRKVFMDAFERIDKEIRIIFSKITNGSAWLEIEKPDSIFDSGVFLMAQFPGKLPRDSSSVSGGEKTISALSLILAIQAVFPSPFYVFDEVDAHLDSVYSGRLADILAERSGYSQLIMVSLKDTVVSKAQSVIGVYMSQGSSKIIRYRSGMEVEVRSE